MKRLILYIFFLSGWLSSPAQSRTDSIAHVFFHAVHDTVIVVTKDRHSSTKDLVYYKIFPDSDKTASPHPAILGIASSEDAIRSLALSVFAAGYRPGENLKANLNVAMDVRIKKETKTADNGCIYVYDVCYAVSLPGDTIYNDCSSDQKEELWGSRKPAEDIKKSITFGTHAWRSTDRRLLYVFLHWEKPEYDSNNGNEYLVSMTQTLILPK